MSFERAVVRLILKKTSLLLSVTLMLRCSLLGCSSGLPPAPGDWSRSDMVRFENCSNCVVVDKGVSLVGGRRTGEDSVRGFLCHQALVCVGLVSKKDFYCNVKKNLQYNGAPANQGRASGGL